MLRLALVALTCAHALALPGLASAQCAIEHKNFDMDGHDLGAKWENMTADECCALCSSTANCAAAVHGDPPNNQYCYFKDSATAGLKAAPGFTFLQPREQHAIPPPTSTCVEWVECVGRTNPNAATNKNGDCPGA